MSGILKKERIDVQAELDLVVFVFGDRRLLVPYQTAFEICNGVRMAAKMASRQSGNAADAWRELAAVPLEERFPTTEKRARQFRRSRLQPNVKAWEIKFESELVILKFDDLAVKIHFSDALRWYTHARAAAHIAKDWAGDSTKKLRMTAHLSDAEENYRRGIT